MPGPQPAHIFGGWGPNDCKFRGGNFPVSTPSCGPAACLLIPNRHGYLMLTHVLRSGWRKTPGKWSCLRSRRQCVGTLHVRLVANLLFQVTKIIGEVYGGCNSRHKFACTIGLQLINQVQEVLAITVSTDICSRYRFASDPTINPTFLSTLKTCWRH